MKRIVLLIVLAAIMSCASVSYSEEQNQQMNAHISDQAEPMDHAVPELPADSSTANSELFGISTYPVSGSMVDYFDGVSGYLSRPEDEKAYPTVVMIHEWWGLNDHIKRMADVLASQGYIVLAVDLYGGKVATTADEARTLVGSLDQNEAIDNMDAAVSYLKALSPDMKTASLGWCFGGGQSLLISLNKPLDATVIYYGNLVTDAGNLSSLHGPVLGLFGAKDTSIPVAAVNEFDQALTANGQDHSIKIYEGVGHAFANPSGATFSADKTKDAWARTVDFLSKNLK